MAPNKNTAKLNFDASVPNGGKAGSGLVVRTWEGEFLMVR